LNLYSALFKQAAIRVNYALVQHDLALAHQKKQKQSDKDRHDE